MLVTYNDGSSGIFDYLEKGQKQGRENTRNELDKRVTIVGNDNVTKSILESTECKYKHITISFKEDDISQEDIEKATNEYLEFLFQGYKQDEYNVYAEIHFPKIKNLETKEGELITRKPHVHLVIPEVNLLSGNNLEPLGFVKSNIKFNDAFVELYNINNDLASPKDNPSNKLPTFDRNNEIKQEILTQILDKNITKFDDMEKVLKDFGVSKLTENSKSGEYWNVKPEHENKYIRLKDYLFSKEFIEKSLDEKMIFLHNEKALEFVQKKENPKNEKTIAQYEKDLAYWEEVRSREVKYVNFSSKFYKEEYKHFYKEERIAYLDKKQDEFYKKYEFKEIVVEGVLDNKTIEKIKEGIENEFIDNRKTPIANIETFERDDRYQNRDGLPLLSSELLVHRGDRTELLLLNDEAYNLESGNARERDKDLRPANIIEYQRGKSEIETKVNVVLDDELRSSHTQKVQDLEIVNYLKGGFDNRRYEIQNDRVKAGDREFTLKEFISHMNIDMKEIIAIEQTLTRIKEELEMKPKVNIQMNKNTPEKVDYYQIGKQNQNGKYTGLAFDQASKIDSAKMYIIDNKAVKESQFMNNKPELYKQIKTTEKELFIPPKVEFNDEIGYEVRGINTTLTDKGEIFAKSSLNFKEIKPVEVGMTQFENKVDKNFFEIAKEQLQKEFKLENMKDALEVRCDLAGSNLVLAAELKAAQVKLDNIKTYQEALEKQKELEQQNTKHISEDFKLKDAIELVEEQHQNKLLKNAPELTKEEVREQQKEYKIDDKFSLKDAIELVEKVQNAKENLETIKDMSSPEFKENAKIAYQDLKIMMEDKDITGALNKFVENKDNNKFYDYIKEADDFNLLEASNMAMKNDLEFDKVEDLKEFKDLMLEGLRIAMTNDIDTQEIMDSIVSKTKEYLSNQKSLSISDEIER